MGRAIYHAINGKKICTGCHENLPEGQFGWLFKKNGKHIQKSKCKECLKKNTEYWRDNHRTRYMEYRKKYFQENKERLRLNRYKQDAKYRGYAVTLTDEQILTMLRDSCYYCGWNDDINGIDRIDNVLGYSPDNTVPCCSTCNMAKKKMTKQEFLDWIKRMALHQGFIKAT
jgi:hypothetical protein